MVSRFCALVFGVVLVAGCAETRYMLQYGVEELGQEQLPRWPAEPELPRYLWAGELTGEGNYRAVQTVQRSQVEEVLAWIVGLALPDAPPRRLSRPYSIVVDSSDRILVTDVGRGAVFVFDEVNGELLIWEQAGELGRFSTPIGIAEGPDGQYLVSDADLGAVIRLDATGQPLGHFGKGILQRPTGLARDPVRGRIFVADTTAHDIKVFDDGGSLLDVFGSRGTRAGEFNGPTLLAYREGLLLVTDTLNTRIQVLDAQGDLVRVFGEQGLEVGDLVRPKGVAVDDEGNIYVVESLHDHLLVFNQQGQLLLPIGGEGTEPGRFRLPAGVTVDGRNRVFVADTFNARVAIFQFLGS